MLDYLWFRVQQLNFSLVKHPPIRVILHFFVRSFFLYKIKSNFPEHNNFFLLYPICSLDTLYTVPFFLTMGQKQMRLRNKKNYINKVIIPKSRASVFSKTPKDRQMHRQSDTDNKAGYTAISYGRVGRGGNARFPTFRLNHYGPTDRPTDGQNLL